MNHGQNFVTLTDSLLIGSGTERDCYQHPDDPNLCIKVNNGKASPHKKPAKQNEIEYRYYTRFLNRQNNPAIVPRCHGWTETNKGRGLVFDLIRNKNGDVAPSLLQALEANQIQAKEAYDLLRTLKQQMLREIIIPCDLHPRNILLQTTDNQTLLVLIDGIGNRNLVKFADVIPWLGRLKIERHWHRLEERLRQRHSLYFSDFSL